MTAIEDLRHTVTLLKRARRWERVQTGLVVALIAAVWVLLPGVMSRRDEAALVELKAAATGWAAERAAWRAWHIARALERGFQLCPPEPAGAPSLMVIVVENYSDLHPRIKTCFRIPADPAPRSSSLVRSAR